MVILKELTERLLFMCSCISSVRMMTDMGFTRDQVDRAMRLAFNNPDRLDIQHFCYKFKFMLLIFSLLEFQGN